jgi:hypothetical protein
MSGRWPPKPRPGTRCDTQSFRVAENSPSPLLAGDRCPNGAVETCLSSMRIELYLCAECADSMVARGRAWRNPKKKRTSENRTA